VLCRFAWKISPSFTEAAPGFEKQVSGTNAAVVIGDRTFELNGKYRYEFDLANEWKKFTGLPFVFAAWVSVTEIEKQFIKDFNEVLSYGVDNIGKAVSESYQGATLSAEEVTEYLTQRIDYRLDDKKMEGLEKFLSLLKQI
jgi:chorismate dehydratase